jgi:hypothetical protein
LWLSWAGALEAVGRGEEALLRLAEASAGFPDEDHIQAALADAYAKMGRPEDAIELARRSPRKRWAQKLRYHFALQSGDLQELISQEEVISGIDPANPDLLSFRASRWRHAPEVLLQYCEDVLQADPSATHAIYHKIVALALLGRGEEARQLMGLDRYLDVGSLSGASPPPGTGIDLDRLRKEILANPTLHEDPSGHATRNGLRTRAFPLPGDDAAKRLVRQIELKVESYLARLPSDHPFVAAAPSAARLKCWALVFGGKGHQTLHHHPASWLTGVFYVAAPSDIPGTGALRIGELPGWSDVQHPWPIVEIAPVPGTIALFPSYAPHRTIATGSTESRISVAFDVGRAESSGQTIS